MTYEDVLKAKKAIDKDRDWIERLDCAKYIKEEITFRDLVISDLISMIEGLWEDR